MKISSNEKKVPMSKLRQTIARRLKDAQNTAAILTTFNEVDMSAIMTLEKKAKHHFKKNMVLN
jgi:2-oxoglutarate dehydrogenase E2 component (dihydrolipoamide succinyltransferase)